MFNFFKKKGGNGKETNSAEDIRQPPSDGGNWEAKGIPPVEHRDSRAENDVTELPTARKDVVNLLIPRTQYQQKSGVGAFLQAMAGKRKKNKGNTSRTESVRISPQKEMNVSTLQRSKSEREVKRAADVTTPPPAKNTSDNEHSEAEFVKSLVLQKYSKPHVSLVYVSNDSLDEKPEKTPDRVNEKRHAEALLREIARTIDCTIDKINDNKQMGTTDSRNEHKEPIYETIDDRSYLDNEKNNPLESYKTDLKDELEKLIEHNKETKLEIKDDARSLESPGLIKKSNLKPPKSDTEGGSDDDRSESGKKRVTFRKHIVFDDGDEQTDEEVDSSFESLTSGEEDDYLEDSLPDNDELLGGIIVPQPENRTLINVNEKEDNKEIEANVCRNVPENGGLKRISSDNSDSGFIDEKQEEFGEVKTLDINSESGSETDTEEETEEEEESEEEEEIIEIVEEFEESIAEVIEPDDPKHIDNQKSLVSQESKFQSQVAALTELADSRCSETERTRELIAEFRKEIEAKDREIEQLKCELASAYKESELVRQRSRSLEEELNAARSCSADLADQLKFRNDDTLRQLRAELEDALAHRAELESRAHALERECDRLERDKQQQEIRAQEALAAAEATTAKWRAAHEAARSQAAARAERMLADCEWKMRELEQKAREADKQKKQLAETVAQLRNAPTAPPEQAHVTELQQLRGLVGEQQRSVQNLSLQLQRVETREESLKLEVHRLKELLDKEVRIGKDKEERYLKTMERLEQQHSKTVETLKAEHATSAAATRAVMERAHAERTRAALAQLRAEADQDARNADRRLREVTAKFEALKEVLATKEREFEVALAEANSKADWDVMQLRHLLDRSDIAHANAIEKLTEEFEQERDRLNEEWSAKIRAVEEQMSAEVADARKTLETTRAQLTAERIDQVNKLKEQHRQELDDQFERFMVDKESCLERMKAECRQEGEEDRVQREKDLLEEIAELKAQLCNSSAEYDTLASKAAACGRTLAVTEQELRSPLGCGGKAIGVAAVALGLLTGSLRLALASFLLAVALLFYLNIIARDKKKEALARERDLREKRADDASKIKQVEKASREQIEHLTRKCACLRKLFDDMRTKMTTRERSTEQDMKSKDRELHQLRAEVARLTKMLVEGSSPKLGARTRADGCETLLATTDGSKGGHHRTSAPYRKRLTNPDLPIKMAAEQNGRPRANSVDLPAVQVPVRIKQIERKSRD